MKLRKSKTGDSYNLTFEISPQEAQRVELFLTWHSSDINDYIEALEQIQKIPKQEPLDFEHLYKFAREAAASSGGFRPHPNQQQYAPEPSWVKILGLKRTATKDEIRAKYRELAKKNHPDKGGDALEFAAITAAYTEAMK